MQSNIPFLLGKTSTILGVFVVVKCPSIIPTSVISSGRLKRSRGVGFAVVAGGTVSMTTASVVAKIVGFLVRGAGLVGRGASGETET